MEALTALMRQHLSLKKLRKIIVNQKVPVENHEKHVENLNKGIASVEKQLLQYVPVDFFKFFA
jgi:hypothetical protein